MKKSFRLFLTFTFIYLVSQIQQPILNPETTNPIFFHEIYFRFGNFLGPKEPICRSLEIKQFIFRQKKPSRIRSFRIGWSAEGKISNGPQNEKRKDIGRFFFKSCGLLRINDRDLLVKDFHSKISCCKLGFDLNLEKTTALTVPQKPARNIQPFHHKYYIAVQRNIAEKHILVLNCGQLLYHPLTLYALKVSKFQRQIFSMPFEPKTEQNYFLISGPLASVLLLSSKKWAKIQNIDANNSVNLAHTYVTKTRTNLSTYI